MFCVHKPMSSRTDLFNACAKIVSEEPRINYRVTEYSQTISFVPKPTSFYTNVPV